MIKEFLVAAFWLAVMFVGFYVLLIYLHAL